MLLLSKITTSVDPGRVSSDQLELVDQALDVVPSQYLGLVPNVQLTLCRELTEFDVATVLVAYESFTST